MGKQNTGCYVQMDGYTGFKKSFFLHTKDEQVEVLFGWFDELESKYSINVKYICCDNAGENKPPQQQLKREGLKIQFKFMSPDTPQQNGVVECVFPTLMRHTRAMMNYTGFNKNMQEKRCKVVNTSIALDGITVPSCKNKCSY